MHACCLWWPLFKYAMTQARDTGLAIFVPWHILLMPSALDPTFLV